MKKDFISVIVPVRNEAKNISPLLERIHKSLTEANINYEVIFVDDHSTDGTFRVVQSLQKQYPLKLFKKQGKVGKAYSIIEGVNYSTAKYVVMIDADLQYPPEVIPEMYKKSAEFGVVVGKRSRNDGSFSRKLISVGFSTVFGKIMHGLKCDVQSGLKLFKREIILQIDTKSVTPWTLDLTLLITARDLGHKIGEVDISFDKRLEGNSKVDLVKTSFEIGKNALKLKIKRKRIYNLAPIAEGSMIGAGVVHQKKKFITHTTLKTSISALQTFTWSQIWFIYTLIFLLEIGLIVNPLLTGIGVIGFLSSIYFIDVLFNLYVILKSLHFPPEVKATKNEIESLRSEQLPIYTILCPLYKEGNVLLQFLSSIEKLDWPKSKLDVILLLEEDDKSTIEVAKSLTLPSYVRIVIVPDSQPKTKPKACNFGLAKARGEYLVIYDAEDQPEPSQLKKAYLAFKKSPENVVCLQAKLNYFNPHQNLLTRFFTAEYSLWFDVVLTGLQSIDTTIPLGGTSNHFRVNVLKKLQGWDPFNVTEDCDLGVRLFKNGLRTAIIDSTTLEEANSKVGNWIRQRSRWIKGYMQTYLVHMRNPFEFIKHHGIHALVFQLIIGARISFMLINPFLWLLTISYFALYQFVGPIIETFYPSIIFYMAATSLVFGNFMYIYNYMIGCAKRGHYSLIKYVFLIPIYWLLASVAAFSAFFQLLFNPHYWEKTAHGLHLKNQKDLKHEVAEVVMAKTMSPQTRPGIGKRLTEKLTELIGLRKIYFGASLLVLSSLIGNICNFLVNAYLGRKLSFEDYGNLSLFTSFLFISTIPLNALSSTITQKIAFLFGKYSKNAARGYLDQFLNKSMIVGLGLMLIWAATIPFLEQFFKSNSILPFIIFSPVWLIGITVANFSGYLKGTLSFGVIALVGVIEAIFKLGIVIGLVTFGLSDLVYAAIPISMVGGLVLAAFFSRQTKKEEIETSQAKFNFPFFLSSLLIGVTNIAFLGLDVVLVKHFLSPIEAGQYALLALPGKMIFFFGSLLAPFMLPLVAKNEGENKQSDKTFAFLFGLTTIFTLIASLSLGFLGQWLLPIFFGEKVYSILPYLTTYAASIVLFTVAQPIIAYFQAKENYTFVIVGFISTITQITLLSLFHQNLNQIIWIMFFISAFNFGLMGILYSVRNYLWVVEAALKDFIGLLFLPLASKRKLIAPVLENQPSILIFNWRDIRHKWAGGAESYLHELGKIWVSQGYYVTIFSGNDSLNPRYEVIDGIQIVRRGGFYMVYFWAFLYYVLRFRGKYDLIIDSENGIPFFTPFYVGKPKFLLIHHIHQEVFRQHLPRPLAILATFLETKLMPFAYKNQKVVTVSDSSKEEILKLGKNIFSQIEIINPGIHPENFVKLNKTKDPTFLYLGRLQPYKNVDVLIKAFYQVAQKYPKASLTIAGYGESLKSLKKLTEYLKLEEKVRFLGRVSEKQKVKLLSRAWVLMQPSMIEGWGMTVIEANASYTPVIASKVNGLKDSIVDGKTGLLIPAKNVDLFAKAMIDLVASRDFREYLSKEAYIWSQNFTWEISNKKFLKLIEQEIKPKSFSLVSQKVLVGK